MSRIFISHSSRDAFEALALRDWLASEGWHDVFLDLDPDRGIVAGERWERSLHQAANRCEAVVFLISANWLASGWCLREYNLARGLNKKLFAALIDPTKTIADLPPELSGSWQAIDLAGGQDLRLLRVQRPGSHEEAHVGFSEVGLRRLRQGLRKAGLDARFFAWPPDGEPERSPYRGFKPLDTADAGIFFGRDGPIVETIDRLRGIRTGAPPRVLALLGASGAGKSSFLRAGLLPRLARDDTHFLPLPPIRPERGALTGENGLLHALETACPTTTRATLRTALQAGADELRPILRALVSRAFETTLAQDESASPPAIVVSIDQAEELFRPEGAAEGAALLALIRDLTATDDPTVIAIFAIRSDSYDALEHAKALEGVPQATLPLLPLPQGAYKEVIEQPARRAAHAGRRLSLEPQLTQRLLEDIEKGGGSDALPLLAFTLEQLYLEYHRSGALRLGDYVAMGGLRGTIDAAVERAFARADRDARIPRERSAREALLRRGLIPWLAGIDPDTRSPRRNIARRADIPAEAGPLIDLLVEERLLSTDTTRVPDPTSGETSPVVTIEPTHEALLRQWGLLEGWLAEDFSLLATLESLKRAARDWDANANDDAWLAHQGQRLADAQALDARPDIAARLDAIDRTYVAACQKREDAERTEAEQRREERAKEQERRIADANALAAATRHTAQRTRIGLAAALVLAAAAAAFGFYAKSQKGVADRKTIEAKLQRDAAEASKSEAQMQRDLAQKALQKATATANGLVQNIAQRFRHATGMPASLTGSILDQALKLQEDLQRFGLNDNDLRRSQAVALNEASKTLLIADSPRKALTYAEKSVAALRGLIADAGANPFWGQDLGLSLVQLGDTQMRLGRLAEAMKTYQEAANLLLETAQKTGTLDDFVALATAFERVGTVSSKTGHLASARKVFDKELEVYRYLATRSKDPQVTRGIFVSLQLIGIAKEQSRDPVGALATYKEALDVARMLVTNGDALAKDDLSIILNKIGKLALGTKDLALAKSSIEESLGIVRALAEDKTNRTAQTNLGTTLHALGSVRLAEGDTAGALAVETEAIAIDRELAKASGSSVSKTELGIGLLHMAMIKRSMKNLSGARADTEEALSIARSVRANDDSNVAARNVAVVLNNLGDVKLAMDDRAAARADYTESLDICRKLATDTSDDTAQFDVLYTLGKVASVSEQPKPVYEEALKRATAWHERKPENKTVEPIIASIKKELAR